MAAISSSPSVSSLQSAQPIVQGAKAIDIDQLPKEWRGISLDEVVISDWRRDKNMAPVDLGQLLKLPIDLEKSAFKGEPPFQLTFRDAAKIIVAVIQRNERLGAQGEFLPIFAPGIFETLLVALSNTKIKRPDLIPSPPQYTGSICCATIADNCFFLGAVLNMLHEEGYITAYGRKDIEFWVKRS